MSPCVCVSICVCVSPCVHLDLPVCVCHCVCHCVCLQRTCCGLGLNTDRCLSLSDWLPLYLLCVVSFLPDKPHYSAASSHHAAWCEATVGTQPSEAGRHVKGVLVAVQTVFYCNYSFTVFVSSLVPHLFPLYCQVLVTYCHVMFGWHPGYLCLSVFVEVEPNLDSARLVS